MLLAVLFLSLLQGWGAESQCNAALSRVLDRHALARLGFEQTQFLRRGDPYRREKHERALQAVLQASENITSVFKRAVELMNEENPDVEKFLSFLRSIPPSLRTPENSPVAQAQEALLRDHVTFAVVADPATDSYWFLERAGSVVVRMVSLEELKAYVASRARESD